LRAARASVGSALANGAESAEGFQCTNNDPALCGSPQSYIAPVFDYDHSNGRCSLTGGYVYRGSQLRCRSVRTSTATRAYAE